MVESLQMFLFSNYTKDPDPSQKAGKFHCTDFSLIYHLKTKLDLCSLCRFGNTIFVPLAVIVCGLSRLLIDISSLETFE